MKKATSKEEAAWWQSIATQATISLRRSRAQFENEEMLAESRKRRLVAEQVEAGVKQARGPQCPIDLGDPEEEEPNPKRVCIQSETPGTHDGRGCAEGA